MKDVPFFCPPSMRPHVEKVLRGEYDVPAEFDEPPRVLDIGANVGAFAIWARKRWPGCKLTCYEPHPDNYAMLWRNVGQYGFATCHHTAVTTEAFTQERVELYEGLHNCGEAGTKLLGEQDAKRSVLVPAWHPDSLPECDVLKLDTEGCEQEILYAYLPPATIAKPSLILLEAHGAKDRDVVTAWLKACDYEVIKDTQTMAHRWTMGFARGAKE